MTPEEFVGSVFRANQLFYDTDKGRGLLETFLPRTFPEPWIYLFELIQNALDAGAKHIDITTSDDEMVFAHDGLPLMSKHVQAISELGMSTKGINSVGFMGVGFKSVFHRFCKVGVSDQTWKFGFHLTIETGPKGDRHPHWVKTVLPEWWPSLPDPEGDSSTTFFFSELRDPSRTLEEDLGRLFNHSEPITLAVLAIRGLQSLSINGENWLLEYLPEKQIVTLYRGNEAEESWSWCALVHEYQPSEDAIRSLLEFRKQRVKEDEQDELAHPRQMVAFVPLDENDEPTPPQRGRVYAALPTDETLCLGMHIQGDWFVDVTRQGLMKIDGDPWQTQILRQIPKLAAQYLRWLAGEPRSETAIRQGLGVLRHPNEEAPQGKLDALLVTDTYKALLRDEVRDVAFVPTHTEDGLDFVSPDSAIFLPKELNVFGKRPERRPDLLFGRSVVHGGLFGTEIQATLRWLGLSTKLKAQDLKTRWPAALQQWWEALAPDDPDDKAAQRQRWLLLFRLWNALDGLSTTRTASWLPADPAVVAWRLLPAIPTADGEWKPITNIRYLNEELPTEKEPGYAGVSALLEGRLPTSAEMLSSSMFRYLRTGVRGESISNQKIRTNAYTWFKNHAREAGLRTLLVSAQQELVQQSPLQAQLLIELAQWALSRNQADVIQYAVVNEGEQQRAEIFSQTLLADPYVDDGWARRVIFPSLPAISPLYLESGDVVRQEWALFFLKRGSKGALELPYSGRRFSAGEVSAVLSYIGAAPEALKRANSGGYRVKLFDFESDTVLSDFPALQCWLEANTTILKGKGRLVAERSYYYDSTDIKGVKPSPWVEKLLSRPWVPDQDGKRHLPAHILSPNQKDLDDYEGAPIAQLSSALLVALEGEGIRFGSDISRSKAIRLLERHNGKLSSEKLTTLLKEAQEESRQSEEEQARFQSVLSKLLLPLEGEPPLSRLVRTTGAGAGRRSSLNGFVPALSDLEEALATTVEKCLTSPPPSTTTGGMALDFLEEVWRQAAAGQSPAAEPLRNALSSAYSYVLQDSGSSSALQRRWEERRRNAWLYVDSPKRRWIAKGPTLCLDDLSDPRLRKYTPEDLQIITAGHLGDSREQQLQTAVALGVQLLSERLNPKAVPEGPVSKPLWERNFAQLIDLLQQRQAKQRQKEQTELHLQVYERLVLRISGEEMPISTWREDNTLLVRGEPLDFTADAAAELVGVYQLSQQGGLVPHLTMALSALDDDGRFRKSASQLAERLGVTFEIPEIENEPASEDPEPDDGVADGPQGSQPDESGGFTPPQGDSPTNDGQGSGGGLSGGGGGGGSGNGGTSGGSSGGTNKPGKYAPDWRGLIRAATNSSSTQSSGGSQRPPKDDKRGREAVIAYEAAHGRTASAGAAEQPGYDVESLAKDGSIRRIEIKGNDALWHGSSSVKLSRRQFDDARNPPENVEYWLYVVDELRTPRPRVLPIPWTKKALSFFFHAEDWEDLAEQPGRVDLPEEIEVGEEPLFDPLETPGIAGLDLEDLGDDE